MNKTDEANNYLNNKVKTIFEPLVAALIKEKPAEPVRLPNLTVLVSVYD